MEGRPSRGEDLRRWAPEILGALVRRYGHFDLAEDAVQEALLAAAEQWPAEGMPDSPRGWLITVASRRLTDMLRSEQARLRREHTAASWTPVEPTDDPHGNRLSSPGDDTLILLFMCCHQALSPASQIALTLRAVGGLSTAEIARAFLVSEEAMTRRITRAKRTIAADGRRFSLPAATDRHDRLQALLHVLYLIFNEGYAASSGESLFRVELSGEAIRLARMLHRLLPEEAEVAGLLALMLLTDARRAARISSQGELVTMVEQDRSLWDRRLITEGVALVSNAMGTEPVGPYRLQAAIAALHDQAPSFDQTDWPQIVALYELLLSSAENPVVALNHAVAIAMAHGAHAGLELVEQLRSDDRIANDHRLHAVRGHLLERAGDHVAACEAYLTAASSPISLPQKRYLHAQAARLQAAFPTPDTSPP